MHSVVAADIISNDPPAIWSEGALGARIQLLRERREELIATSPPPPVDETSFLSRTFAQIFRDRQQQAFQTTFVSARVTSLTDGSVLLTAMLCGDSALLVFDERGRLLLSRREIADEGSPFHHGSPITQVLPDHEHALTTVEQRFSLPLHVVLCSDGFYDAFPNPSALFRWLLLNCDSFDHPDAELRFAELHERLDRTRGDDDMSFVWIYPHAVAQPAPETAPAETQPTSTWGVALAARLRRIGWRLLSLFGLTPPAPRKKH